MTRDPLRNLDLTSEPVSELKAILRDKHRRCGYSPLWPFGIRDEARKELNRRGIYWRKKAA